MISRLKPYFGIEELRAIFKKVERPVEKFEQKFARTFKAKYAISFRYGRSGLYALFKALDIKNKEIIIPAYTCVVVAHAIVLSGNIPRFIDSSLYDYNMDLNLLEKAINENTAAIIPTHIFGYPLDIDKLKRILFPQKRKIMVIQDCAHSFGAKFNGKYVCNEGDIAIFGLNISKQISSIFGGMVITNDEKIYQKLKQYRDKHFYQPSIVKQFNILVYFLSTYFTFNKFIYSFVNFLEEKTKLIDRFTKYYREDTICFPKDYQELLTSLEAKVGLAQLEKYPEIAQRRKFIASFYNEHLKDLKGIDLPPIVEGATYSHYIARVKNRKEIINKVREEGIQLGQLIEYSIPHMKAYKKYCNNDYKNSLYCSGVTINLPNYPGLSKKQLELVVKKIKKVVG